MTNPSIYSQVRSFIIQINWCQAPVLLCQVPVKFVQQPVLRCHGLLGVRTGIIEQRPVQQTDVANIKKYTTSELKMSCGAAKKGRWRWLRLYSAHNSLLQVEITVIVRLGLWWEAAFLKLFRFLWKDLRDATKNQHLFATYCRFIIQKQRVSGHSMLCHSVLKHLRHSSSVMKSVKERGIWQNVLRTMFYHKCFVLQSSLLGCLLTRNYKSVWIFDGSRKHFCQDWVCF